MTSFSGVDGLELTEVPEPTPGDGEELVNVRAASLGPWDLSAAGGAFTAIGGSGELPQVAGWDFAGETADGRRVLGFVAQPWMGVGALAERIAVPSGDPGDAARLVRVRGGKRDLGVRAHGKASGGRGGRKRR